MSYVEHCNQHGQYHGDYCGECVEATQADRDRWKKRAEDMGDKAHDTRDELEKAKARIEELTHLWAKDNNALVDALLQNKRLLEALEWIANYQNNVSTDLDGFTSLGLIGRAKSALSRKEPS